MHKLFRRSDSDTRRGPKEQALETWVSEIRSHPCTLSKSRSNEIEVGAQRLTQASRQKLIDLGLVDALSPALLSCVDNYAQDPGSNVVRVVPCYLVLLDAVLQDADTTLLIGEVAPICTALAAVVAHLPLNLKHGALCVMSYLGPSVQQMDLELSFFEEMARVVKECSYSQSVLDVIAALACVPNNRVHIASTLLLRLIHDLSYLLEENTKSGEASTGGKRIASPRRRQNKEKRDFTQLATNLADSNTDERVLKLCKTLIPLSSDSVVAGIMLTENVVKECVKVINLGEMSLRLSAAAIVVNLSGFETYKELMDIPLLLSLYKSFIVLKECATAQTIALDALMQFLRLSPYEEIPEIDRLECILPLLSNDPKEGQWHALGLITELAEKGYLETTAFLRTCVRPVVELVCSCDIDETRALAATTLLALSRVGELQGLIVSEGGLDPLLAMLAGKDLFLKESAVETIRNVSETEGNKANIGRSSIVLGRLLTVTKQDTSTMSVMALHALVSLVMDEDNQTKIVQAGAMELVLEMSLLDLEVSVNRELLHALACANDVQVLWATAQAIRNLARKSHFAKALCKVGALDALYSLLQSDHSDVLWHTCGALCQFFAQSDENKETAFSAERSVLPRLLELLNSIDPKIHGEAVAVVGCLATHKNPDYKAMLVDYRLILPVVRLLSTSVDLVLQRACLALRVLAINDRNRQAIMEAGALPFLRRMSMQGEESVRKEANALLNTLRKSRECADIIDDTVYTTRS